MFDYPFQLDQIIINGNRFFEMIFFYDKMIEEIENNDASPILKTIKNYTGNFRTGDKYVSNLFYCGLIYYIDKFGQKELQKAVEKIFIWAYTLRLKLYSVGLDSIDNYALNKAHSHNQLFKQIREAIRPNDIINMKLETLKKENIKREIEEIVKLFKEMKYYE